MLALDDVVNITFFRLVDGGQVLDAPPCVVIVGEGVEAVPAVVGRLLTLRRAERGIEAVGVEIDAFSPRVVENAVEQHADAALARSFAERAEVLLRAEQGVDALVAGRVVAVVGGGFEDRTEVERCHAEGGEIVELFRDARKVAAEKVAASDLALFVRAVFRQLVPLLVQRAWPDKSCDLSLFRAVEAVGEDLIGEAAAEPLGRFVRVIVDRELPRLDRVPRAKAGLPVAARAAVRPEEPKVIPHEVCLSRRDKCAAKDGRAVLPRCFQRDGLPMIGKFRVGEQLAARDGRARLGPQAELHARAAGHRAEGRFVAKIAGVEPRS